MSTPANKHTKRAGYWVIPAIMVILASTMNLYAEDPSPEIDLVGLLEKDFKETVKVTEPNTVSATDPAATDTPVDNRPAKSTKHESDNDLLFASNPTTPIQRELWKARISAAEQQQTSSAKSELEQLIEQLSSMEIAPPAPPATPEPPTEPLQAAEPNEIIPQAVPQGPETVEQSLPGQLTEETLERFKALSQTPEQLENPLELAEILFACGYLQEAASCYRMCLADQKKQQAELLYDQAWILFQLGNCLKDRDPRAALDNYQAVVEEHPASPWASLAKVKSDLIEWQLKDQPLNVIKESALLSQQ